MRLLVDDNPEVRFSGSRVVSFMNSSIEFKCTSEAMKIFFETFTDAYKDDICSIFAAYFVWSLALSEDDYQMDDSDVSVLSINFPFRI